MRTQIWLGDLAAARCREATGYMLQCSAALRRNRIKASHGGYLLAPGPLIEKAIVDAVHAQGRSHHSVTVCLGLHLCG